ncbi:unnamed protein product [Didymodactylos carnosus]|uniref:Uncharacterized protein n=1 Tax=Didymodactylos carnosus TaxID=1234261 RepID=A0A814UZ34_9BILA|nr:unnamed protein product [Didymodactylos carnosus]CAF1505300.1 unnamed protein product [Didymodactylos carnosus]CAF3947071.1 unnamed protein product [Didymodactylos carnosus]CAF4293633.1 unnamed protein product [Didymodactylos carnosus]
MKHIDQFTLNDATIAQRWMRHSDTTYILFDPIQQTGTTTNNTNNSDEATDDQSDFDDDNNEMNTNDTRIILTVGDKSYLV